MSVSIKVRQKNCYRTTEACEIVGISRSTLLRWIRDGVLEDASLRDRRGWRLFTQADIERIEDEVHKVNRSKSGEMSVSNFIK
jgi:excisionase family DNA binding protein